MEQTEADPLFELDVDLLELRVASDVRYIGPKKVKDVWENQVIPSANECEAEGVLPVINKLSLLAKTAREISQTLSRPLRERDARWFNKQARRLNKRLGKLVVSHASEQAE